MNENQRGMAVEFQKLMATPEGKKLFALLSSDGGETLKSAGASLRAGDDAGAKDKMAPLLNNSEVKKLLAALEKKMGNG